jgi:hypothetical protein
MLNINLKNSIMKVTVDGFVWLLVNDKAKEIWNNGLFELFILHEDDSESLVESWEQLDEAISNALSIGIEVGHLYK